MNISNTYFIILKIRAFDRKAGMVFPKTHTFWGLKIQCSKLLYHKETKNKSKAGDPGRAEWYLEPVPVS